ncbi:tyrosine-type recombinase/integrase [Spongorhabdus nitratireducens]
MASFSIEKRTRKDGTIRYRCVVRVKKDGVIIHRESQTFSTKNKARAYGKKRSVELEDPHYLKSLYHQDKPAQHSLLGTLIEKYQKEIYPLKPWGRTKHYVLDLLLHSALAAKNVYEIKAADIITHCKSRKEAGAGPATIAHDISYLRAVLATAKPNWEINVDASAIDDAMLFLSSHNLIGHSKPRDRRPTREEVKQIRSALEKRQSARQSTIPLVDIFDFSIQSCMRIGEVCRILWEDLDLSRKAIKVRDRKDPRHKKGNDLTIPLLGETMEIIQRQQMVSDRIFPYDPRSVSAAFQRCRNKLGIKNLRYHDLRREGATRLMELGHKIEDVATVTGHKDINVLWKIYTAISPESVHEKHSELTRKKKE